MCSHQGWQNLYIKKVRVELTFLPHLCYNFITEIKLKKIGLRFSILGCYLGQLNKYFSLYKQNVEHSHLPEPTSTLTSFGSDK